MIAAMQRNDVMRTLLGALIGAILGLALGLAAVQLAPENGFADLAAAALTRILLIPIGVIAGGVIGYRRGR